MARATYRPAQSGPAGEVYRPAIELDVSEWIGTPSQLESLRGKVVLVEAFQMLCPGCVSNGIPQAQRVRRILPEVVVLGLHCVFEHHSVQGPDALRAFISEYRIDFPVGIDRNDGGYMPVTMKAYGLKGTPSTLLIDRAGRLRQSLFGTVNDIGLGAHLGMLLAEHPEQEPPMDEDESQLEAISPAPSPEPIGSMVRPDAERGSSR